METKYEYTRTTYAYHASYLRNTKAVGVLWAIFTICFAIINIIVFIEPFWLGNSTQSLRDGDFGLYRYRVNTEPGVSVENQWKGQFGSFDTILNPYFKAATILIGISALIILICVACMVLFFFLSSKSVYCICGWMQLVCFLCMLAGCIVFAAAWEPERMSAVCGYKIASFNPGDCELRWAYVLAILGIFDILFLCILAFVLATKQVKPLPEVPRNRGNDNLAFNGMYTRGPVITPLELERMSQFSTARIPNNRSKAEYASSVQNFQL